MQEEDDNGTQVQGRWIRRIGYVSEHDIDARFVLFYEGDTRPHGSLRIVSHPDLPPGHLKAFVTIITKRWPKTKEELEAMAIDKCGIKYPIYGLTQEEMETYNVHENFETWEPPPQTGPKREIEKMFGVSVFG
jgi:hypothetical protein